MPYLLVFDRMASRACICSVCLSSHEGMSPQFDCFYRGQSACTDMRAQSKDSGSQPCSRVYVYPRFSGFDEQCFRAQLMRHVVAQVYVKSSLRKVGCMGMAVKEAVRACQLATGSTAMPKVGSCYTRMLACVS